MINALFDRYQKALRNGHVAAARGRLGDALVAYREAIGLAGDRPLPYAALAEVLFRLGDIERSLETCDEALELDHGYEAALLGRARALEVLDRTDEAAETYDRLADALALTGRLSAACDAVVQAMEYRSTPARRHRLQELGQMVRLAGGDIETERTLGRALAASNPALDEGEAALSPRETERRAAADAAEAAAARDAAELAPQPAPQAPTAPPTPAEVGPVEAAVGLEVAGQADETMAADATAKADASAEANKAIGADEPAEADGAIEAGDLAEADETAEADGAIEAGDLAEADETAEADEAIEAGDLAEADETAEADEAIEDRRAIGTLAAESGAAGEEDRLGAEDVVAEAAPSGRQDIAVVAGGSPDAFEFEWDEVPPAAETEPIAGSADVVAESAPPPAALQEPPASSDRPLAQPVAARAVRPARPPVPNVDPEALVIAAEESAARGDVGSSVVAAMLAARVFGSRDAANAALDVCTSALALAPAHVELHLQIAELYVDRGWNHLAGETYLRLLSLTRLDEDTMAHAHVLEAARANLPGDARFAS
jgi:tetratricopeptide (TPR) repeat protein